MVGSKTCEEHSKGEGANNELHKGKFLSRLERFFNFVLAHFLIPSIVVMYGKLPVFSQIRKFLKLE